MKLVSKIFRRTDWYVTSSFGWRIHPIDKVKKFHYGTDYGTNAKKWPLYAIEDGYVQKVVTGQDKAKSGYGNYVWVRYPRINISLLHAHMDSVKVKKGDKVKEGTLLGYTGKTGAATGIHLHLGMTKIGSNTYLDAHAYNYTEPEKPKPTPTPVPTPTPSDDFKVGDKVVPTKLYDYRGKKLVQYDKQYVISSIDSRGCVLRAIRGSQRPIWAVLPKSNIKKVG